MRVAVVGLGGLGHLAVQFASKMGGLVTAVGLPEDGAKAGDLEALGARETVTSPDDLPPCTFGIVLNTTWSPCDAGKLMAALAAGGTFIQLGMPWNAGATGTQAVNLEIDSASRYVSEGA